MTFLQFVSALLTQKWEPAISGRVYDLPTPGEDLDINIEKEVHQKRLRTNDIITVRDGGDVNFTPLGFGWTHEQIEGAVTIECRCADENPRVPDGVDGRVRMFGYRNQTNQIQNGLAPFQAERHGGLTGEVVRILASYRKGHAEFDRLVYGPVRDESSTVGRNTYRGDIMVAPEITAQEIDASV